MPFIFTSQNIKVNEEFLRITTKPLQTKFLAQLDHFSEKLFQIFDSKGGVKGQKIKRILAIKDEVCEDATKTLLLCCGIYFRILLYIQ